MIVFGLATSKNAFPLNLSCKSFKFTRNLVVFISLWAKQTHGSRYGNRMGLSPPSQFTRAHFVATIPSDSTKAISIFYGLQSCKCFAWLISRGRKWTAGRLDKCGLHHIDKWSSVTPPARMPNTFSSVV